MQSLAALRRSFARDGRIAWIGLRPARRLDLRAVSAAQLGRAGLEGDHARPGKRAVTLIQAEHLPVIAGLAGRDDVAPETLRRNIVISGINLRALRETPVRLGEAMVRLTVVCAPCSRMEAVLGQGGYTAMRGHGGWCAEVLEPGEVALGASVRPVFDAL